MDLNKPYSSRLSLALSVLLIIAAGFADEDSRFRRIREAVDKFSYMYPQQKAYLHMDKSEYRSGENIWIKAYLLNGLNHLPDTISTNLYVELISPYETRVEIKRFQMFSGFGVGDFSLSDTLPEGLYQIRAFTSWMQNFDPDFYFKRNFQVINPRYSKIISPREARVNQKEIVHRDKLEEDVDLQFMPEGGWMVNGLESVIAFRAINRLGKGVELAGDIVDDRDAVVSSFQTFRKGIGTFRLKPAKDKNYFALYSTGGRKVRVPLPKPLESGLVMRADDSRESVRVRLYSNRPRTNDRSANEVILVGQVGGKIFYHTVLNLENDSTGVEVPKSRFPVGILQLTAFSGRGDPLAERLVYISRPDFLKIRFEAADSFGENGIKVVVNVFVTDTKNNPVPANLSLSVTRDKELEPPVNRDNIVSHILLSSDIKGHVEDPYDYFYDQSPPTLQAIDNLMLTHGWRRFEWEKIIGGEFPEIKYHEERGISIYGQITHDFFSIPLKNCKVQLSIMDAYNDVFTQTATEKGYFLFDRMVYYDTISVKIEAWRPNGRRNLVIVLPDEKINEIRGFQGDHSLITLSERDQKAFRVERFEEARIAYLEDKEQQKEQQKDELKGIYSEPDFVLRSDDFPKGNRDIIEVIKGRIPGVNVIGDKVQIRGPGSFFSSNEPLYLIDGMPVRDVDAVKSIPVEQIERVEVLKGPSAAIYGMRGSNGVIAIYTKRGHYMKRGVIEFDMLGFNTPRAFYQPRYIPENEPDVNYTLVWEPVILVNESGKATVVFDKPSIQGDYRFIIEGASYMGLVGMAERVMSNE
jgi:TonB-dependent SusC/RagA subfamily outer membrane receptor